MNGYESRDQVRGIVPVPPMEMKGNGTVLEHPTTPSASEEQPCPVSTSRQFAGRSRWSRCWTCSASSPRHDRGCSGREAVRYTPPRRAIAARSLGERGAGLLLLTTLTRPTGSGAFRREDVLGKIGGLVNQGFGLSTQEPELQVMLSTGVGERGVIADHGSRGFGVGAGICGLGQANPPSSRCPRW